MRSRSWWLPYLFLTPAIATMILLVFYPLLKGIGFSFTDMNQYNMGTPFSAPSYRFVGLANYVRVLAPGSPFWSVLRQTFIWTFVNVVLHFAIGLALAIALHRRLAARAIYRLLFLVPWAVPSFVSAFAWRWLFNFDYGFINLLLRWLGWQPVPWLSDPVWAMVSVIATNVWLGFPFMMVVMLGGLQAIPRQLYEAAWVDGAGSWTQFRYVTLPMLRPVAFTATLLGVIWTFNMFNVIYLITEGGPSNSTQILVTFAYLQAFGAWDFGLATTYGVLILSMLIAFSYLYSRALRVSQGEAAWQ